MAIRPSADYYEQQIAALRAELDEAQETLRAIRQGEIDALLITGQNGGQVFALENTDRPYRVLVEAMQEGAATLLPNGMILYANRRFADLLHLSLDKVFGAQVHRFLTFSDQVTFASILRESMSAPVHSEVTFRAEDGTLIPVSIALSPLSLQEVPAIAMIATDLTQQKQREKDILLLQQLQTAVSEANSLQAALEVVLAQISQMKQAVYAEAWTLSEGGEILEFTSMWASRKQGFQAFADAAEAQSKAPNAGLIGTVWRNKMPMVSHNLQEHTDFIRRSIAESLGLKASIVTPVRIEDGIVAVLAFFSDDSKGIDEHFVRLVSTVAGQLGSFIQRKQAEAALLRAHRELEDRVVERTAELTRINAALQAEVEERTRIADRIARLQDIIVAFSASLTRQQVTDVILSHGLESIGALGGSIVLLGDGNMVDILTGNAASPGLSEPCVQALVNDLPALVLHALETKAPVWSRAHKEIVRERIEAPDPAAQESATWSVVPLIVGDKVIGALELNFPPRVVIDDDMAIFVLALAEQCAQALERAHLYEAEAKARQEAELANQVKLKFLGMVSHELRTPLTSIKGFLSTLLADDVDWHPAQQEEFLRIADREADKLTTLVDQLLDLSRLQAGHIHIAPRQCSLGEIYEIASAEIETLTQSHRLVVSTQSDLPAVLADPHRIAQVLVNLVGNAAKFSPLDSTIMLSAYGRDGFLQINVEDQGPGIPLESHEIIFEAFRQLHQTSENSNRQGAGLGLAICKGLLEAHGGRIWIDPAYTNGARVCFTVPCA